MKESNVHSAQNNHPFYLSFHILTFLVVFFLIWAFSDGYLSSGYLAHLEENFDHLVPRPFVYRIFVPIVCKGLMTVFNIQANTAYIIVVITTTIGATYSLHYLFSSFWKQNFLSELFIILGIAIMFLLIHNQHMKIYDTSTLFFFTLALLLLNNDKPGKFLALFPLISLNKETSILLTMLYAIIYYRKQDRRSFYISMLYQLLIYFLIRFFLMNAFQDNEGVVARFWPLRNIKMYIDHPGQTIILFLVTGGLLFLIFKDWKNKPVFLRLGFLTFVIPLSGLYFFMGVSFEYRVFIEAFPVIFLLILPNFLTHQRNLKT